MHDTRAKNAYMKAERASAELRRGGHVILRLNNGEAALFRGAEFADGEDIELWSQFKFKNLHLVLLALPTVKDSKTVSEQLRAAGYTGKIVAISRFDDEASGLEAAGIDKVLNLMNNAGAGFAEESLSLLRKSDSLEGSQV